MAATAVLEALRHACTRHGARPGAPGDEVDGVLPSMVAFPTSTPELAATMATAAAEHLVVVARGAGTKLDWGLPPRSVDLLVDCSQMAGVLEHAKGDLVLRALAGTPLSTLQEGLADAGQWLPLDEVVPGSTLGGIVATGLSGPSRQAHGAVRDLLIGVTVVRADGVVARAGGKVVKNVAGYDLSKLFTGSYGTLALLAELVLRLAPRPAARRFLTFSAPADDLAGALRFLRRAPEAPSAVELTGGPSGSLELTVLLEGRPGPLEDRANALSRRLGPLLRAAPDPPPGWGQLPGATTLKVTAPPGDVADLLHLAARAAAAEGLSPTVRAQPGVGVVLLGLPPDVPATAVAGLLAALRRRPAEAGWAVVLRGPRDLRSAVDGFGPAPGLELMRRIKDQLDPEHRLAPGRFVGGI